MTSLLTLLLESQREIDNTVGPVLSMVKLASETSCAGPFPALSMTVTRTLKAVPFNAEVFHE